MSSVGNLFICGKSTSGAWSEVSNFCGNSLEGLDGRSRLACLRAGSVRRFLPLAGAAPVSSAVADAASRLAFSPPVSYGDTAVARTGLGAVYVWGAARAGERGTLAASAAAREIGSGKDVFDATEPSLVPRMDAGVVDVAVGAAHVVTVTSAGIAYAWGSDERGQLGVSPTSERGQRLEKVGDFSAAAPVRPGAGDFCGIPRIVVSLSHVPLAKVFAGAEFTLFLSQSGDVYSCGAGGCGQLGVGRVTSLTVPVRITFPEGTAIVSIATGPSHALAVASDGGVFAWGLNATGQLGVGDFTSRFVPTAVCDAPLISSALSLDGIGEGEDPEGSVLATQRIRPDVPRALLRATAVATGTSHSAIIARDGRVLTMGCAEHGRLGHSFALKPASDALGVVTEVLTAPPPNASRAPWPFRVNGVGPLSVPDRDGPRIEPPHVARNAARPPPELPLRDVSSGQPDFDAVKAGTWVLPLTRTRAHVVAREKAAAFDRAREATESRAAEGVSALVSPLTDPQARATSAIVRPVHTQRTKGMPWLRAPLERSTVAAIPSPTVIDHNMLAGRVVSAVSCTDKETILFCPAMATGVSPASARDTGGARLTISGPGIASLLSLPEVALAAALEAAPGDATAAAAAYRTYAPVRHPVTGLMPIAGVSVRFTLRSDDASSGFEVFPREGDKAARARARTDEPCFYMPAYYPAGYSFSGFADAARAVDAHGGDDSRIRSDSRPVSRGASATSRPNSFRIRVDGSLHATTARAVEEGLDVNADTLVCFAPRANRPCTADVAVCVAREGGGGDAVPLAGSGGLRFSFFSEPTVVALSPASIAVVGGGDGSSGDDDAPLSTVRLTGEGFFGAALADPVARPVAEALLSRVAARVRARAAEEEVEYERELATSRGGVSERSSASELITDAALAGSAAAPCDVLVAFDVSADGGPPTKLDPMRGWLELSYTEARINLAAAATALAIAATGSLRSTSVHAQPAPPQDDDDADEAIVSSYDATIVVALPDVSTLLGASALPDVPADIVEAATASAAAPSGAPSPVATRFSYAQELSLAAQGRGAPSIILSPRVSFNLGAEWAPVSHGAQLRPRRPELSHAEPAISPLETWEREGVRRVRLRGLFFADSDEWRVAEVTAAGELADDGFAARASFLDSTTLTVDVPWAVASRHCAQARAADNVSGIADNAADDASELALAVTAPPLHAEPFVGSVVLRLRVTNAAGAELVAKSPLVIVAFAGGAGDVTGPWIVECKAAVVPLDAAHSQEPPHAADAHKALAHADAHKAPAHADAHKAPAHAAPAHGASADAHKATAHATAHAAKAADHKEDDSVATLPESVPEHYEPIRISLPAPTGGVSVDALWEGGAQSASWWTPTLRVGGTLRAGLCPRTLAVTAVPVGTSGGAAVELSSALSPDGSSLVVDLIEARSKLGPGRWSFQVHVRVGGVDEGAPFPARGSLQFFSQLAVLVGHLTLPKKLIPGVEISAAAEGLAAALGYPPPPPPTTARSRPASAAAKDPKSPLPKAAKGAAAPVAGAAHAKTSAALTPVVSKPPSPESARGSGDAAHLPPITPPPGALVAALTTAGHSAIFVPVALSPDATSFTFTLPAGDAMPPHFFGADVHCALSLSGGAHCGPASATAFKIAKK